MLHICEWFVVIVQLLSCVRLLVTPWPAAHQASCPSPSPRVCSNSCLLIRWCHPTISSSVVPFSSCLLSFHHSNKPEQNQDFFSLLLPFTSLPIWFLSQNGVMATTLPTQINPWLISAMLQPRRPIWTQVHTNAIHNDRKKTLRTTVIQKAMLLKNETQLTTIKPVLHKRSHCNGKPAHSRD